MAQKTRTAAQNLIPPVRPFAVYLPFSFSEPPGRRQEPVPA